MVIKSDNATFLSDLMCSDPEVAVSIIEEALGKSVGNDQVIKYHMGIKDTVRKCSCTNTPDGLKACLVLSREDISDHFKTAGISKSFNDFMAELDDSVSESRNTLAVNWYL